MNLTSILLGLFSVLLMAWGQILFKIAGLAMQAPLHWQQWLSLPMIAAFTVSGIATILWVWVLRSTPLYVAYPIMALTFFLVPLGAYFMLHEPISYRTFVGAGLILLGIAVSYT